MDPATLLLSVALVPAAPHFGVTPWVVGFVVLVGAITWLLPNQSDFCRLMSGATNGELFTACHAMVVGVLITLVTLLGIGVSIPYWKALGWLGIEADLTTPPSARPREGEDRDRPHIGRIQHLRFAQGVAH